MSPSLSLSGGHGSLLFLSLHLSVRWRSNLVKFTIIHVRCALRESDILTANLTKNIDQ